MPNTIPAAGEAMPENKPDIADLESPIADAVRMASVASRLITDCIGRPNKGNKYYLTDTQVEDMLFSAYQTADFIKRIYNAWELLLTDERTNAAHETVSSLFSQWAANPDACPGADYSGKSQAQLNAVFAEYTSLQQRIVGAVPMTAEEVAQQIIAATDDGASSMPEELFDRLRQMARRAKA
ncbi:hypothetical protein [Agrobacterium tumefaciens]|uniref:hypothetical protein n=1 Tax=Agrobacterium tumefaciens TaxID=358 RepID=UPI001FA9641D|nr:hypothetical protein [Agrobacterium tumefaciens]UNZ49333.1 hypothetical protein MLE07_08005 [Agrobacterium tumefaciens]